MMRFCKECNNLLYPRENVEQRKLEYACKLCPFVDKNITGSCVWVNELIKNTTSGLEVVNSDLNKVCMYSSIYFIISNSYEPQDPTLQRSRTVECSRCGHNEAVLFQVNYYTS
jgi:DNA-directed RNA polymerase II subunit RPB9